MNDNPHGWSTSTDVAWQGWAQNLVPSRIEGLPSGTRRAALEAEEVLSTAIGWWDASRYRSGDRFLRNQGMGGELLNLRLGSGIISNSNEPYFLPVEDEGYLFCAGSLNGALISNDAPIQITGNIDIKVKLRLPDWSPPIGGQAYTFVGKGDLNLGEVNSSYHLSMTASGNIYLRWFESSGVGQQITSSIPVPVPDGDVKWIRATLNTNNGNNQYVVKFYVSDDGVGWTQLGNTIVNNGTTSIRNAGGPLYIGSYGPNFQIIGNVYRVIIQAAYDTTNNTDSVRLDADFTNLTRDQVSFNESASGLLVTIERGSGNSGLRNVIMPPRSLGGRPLFTVGSTRYLEVTDRSQDQMLTIDRSQGMTVLIAHYMSGLVSNGSLIRKNTANTTFSIQNNAGGFSTLGLNCTQITQDGRTLSSSGPGLTTYGFRVYTAIFTPMTGSFTFYDNITQYTGTLNREINTSSISNLFIGGSHIFEFYGAAIFRRVLTPLEVELICRYYGTI